MLQEKQFKREAAMKADIAGLNSTRLDEEATARRVNVMATVVETNEANPAYKAIAIDDGTGQIQLKVFGGGAQPFEMPETGNFILAIGKLRSYNDENYIVPEIIKRLDNIKWAEARKLELRLALPAAESKPAEKPEEMINEKEDAVSREKIGIYNIVKQLDTGRGADVSEVAAMAGGTAEAKIREMLSAGDLFEVLPGKLKVLE